MRARRRSLARISGGDAIDRVANRTLDLVYDCSVIHVGEVRVDPSKRLTTASAIRKSPPSGEFPIPFISFVAFVSDGCDAYSEMSKILEPSRLSPDEQGALRSIAEALHAPERGNAAKITLGRKPLDLPAPALSLVAEVVEHLAAGRAVAVMGADEEISPREAAEILGVSRPFAARLFDEGRIPSRRVGTHRRALARDVIAYRDQQHAARRAALDELAAEGQRLGLGY